MSVQLDKTVRSFVKSLENNSAKKKTSGYTKSAEVIRVSDGIAWVHFVGGVDETPAEMAVAAKAGDIVRVQVSGKNAVVTGNMTAPPDDSGGVLDKVEEIVDRVGDFDPDDMPKIERVATEYCLATATSIPEDGEFEDIQYEDSDWSEEPDEYPEGETEEVEKTLTITTGLSEITDRINVPMATDVDSVTVDGVEFDDWDLMEEGTGMGVVP